MDYAYDGKIVTAVEELSTFSSAVKKKLFHRLKSTVPIHWINHSVCIGYMYLALHFLVSLLIRMAESELGWRYGVGYAISCSLVT